MGDQRFGMRQLSLLLQSDTAFKNLVAQKCGALSTPDASPLEKVVLENLPIPARPDPASACTIAAQGTHATRLRLRTHWDFLIQIRDAQASPFAQRHYSFDVPRPLVLLPLFAFVLALICGFPYWGMRWTVGSYFFLACGASLVQATHSAVRVIKTTFTQEPTTLGMLLVVVWVALCRAHRKPARTHSAVPMEARWLNRGVLAALSLWNPAAFTLTGRLLLPFRGAAKRVAPLLGLQVAALCLSVYLLSLTPDPIHGLSAASLRMPRYFTFACLLFIFLQYTPVRKETFFWKLPGIWRTLICVCAVEGICFFFSKSQSIGHLTRIGTGLVLGQLIWPFDVDWKRAWRCCYRWGGALVLALSLTTMSTQLGVTDLVFTTLNPSLHPTGNVFFTFICGIALGFTTGGFAAAFFTLFTAMTKSASVPLSQAAMLDGILAGILLSPFSVINLIPASQFGLKMQKLISHRVHQLGYPLTIGLMIYALSAVTTVAILRPATFVFLCLIAVAVHLKKSGWKFGKYTISPDLRSGVH